MIDKKPRERLRARIEQYPLLKDAFPPETWEATITDLCERWCEPHRSWHGPKHLADLLQKIAKRYRGPAATCLQLIALYHDAIYNPKAKDNEEKSTELWLLSPASQKNKSLASPVAVALLETKYKHRPSSQLGVMFMELDCAALHASASAQEKQEYEEGIRQEYLKIGWKKYKALRTKFLAKWGERFPEYKPGTEAQLDILETLKPNRKPDAGIQIPR